jgi:hypothetical protein
VTGAFLGIGDDLREPSVQLPALRAGGGSVDRGGEQRMRETNPVSLRDEHSGLLGREERRQGVVAFGSERLHDCCDRGSREGSGDQDGLPCDRRERSQAFEYEFLEALWYREGVAKPVVAGSS